MVDGNNFGFGAEVAVDLVADVQSQVPLLSTGWRTERGTQGEKQEVKWQLNILNFEKEINYLKHNPRLNILDSLYYTGSVQTIKINIEKISHTHYQMLILNRLLIYSSLLIFQVW